MTIYPTLSTLGPDDVYVITTIDGSPTLYSRSFDATYHSINGAVSESRHVFIQHGLSTQQGYRQIKILEFGVGTGLNAFLAFLFSKKKGVEIQYSGIELFPIDLSVAKQLQYADYLAASEESETFLRLHTEPAFTQDQFSFQRLSGFNQLGLEDKFHCVFFDAFSPGEHAEAWSQDVFDIIGSKMDEGACLVTYCARGEVRRTIEKAGFKVNRIAGAPGKREMIQAFRLP